MKAIYDNRVYEVADASIGLTLETMTGKQFGVDYDDERLIIDPTDEQVAGADNLTEHYGVSEDLSEQLRRMLRGEISVRQWEDWKAERTRR